MRLLPYVAALFTLQLVLAAVTKGLDALSFSHYRRSSACNFASHASAGDEKVSQHRPIK